MVDEPLMEVLLAQRSYPSSISSRLTASIEDAGLVLSGQDLGPGVEEIWGDLDYEYWLSVDSEYLDLVLDGLAKKLDRAIDIPEDTSQRDWLLLDLLKRSWSRGLFETDVDFRKWLDAIDVPSEFSSYV